MKVNNKLLLDILRKFAKNKPTDKEQINKKIDKLVDDMKRSRLYIDDHRLSKNTGSIVKMVSWEYH
jgi:hypothetical protein